MENFNSNLAEQRKKVALDLSEELRKIRQQRDDLLTACENAENYIREVLASEKRNFGSNCTSDIELRDELEAAIEKANKEN